MVSLNEYGNVWSVRELPLFSVSISLVSVIDFQNESIPSCPAFVIEVVKPY